TNDVTVVLSVGPAVASLPFFGLMPSHLIVSLVLISAPGTKLLHDAPAGNLIDAVNAPSVIGYFDATLGTLVRCSSVPESLIVKPLSDGVAVTPGENFTVPMFLFGFGGVCGSPAPISHVMLAGAVYVN